MTPQAAGAAPAYPQPENWPDGKCPGLTKREYFAAMAMQGLLAHGAAVAMTADEYALLAKWSAMQADALLAALQDTP